MLRSQFVSREEDPESEFGVEEKTVNESELEAVQNLIKLQQQEDNSNAWPLRSFPARHHKAGHETLVKLYQVHMTSL